MNILQPADETSLDTGKDGQIKIHGHGTSLSDLGYVADDCHMMILDHLFKSEAQTALFKDPVCTVQ